MRTSRSASAANGVDAEDEFRAVGEPRGEAGVLLEVRILRAVQTGGDAFGRAGGGELIRDRGLAGDGIEPQLVQGNLGGEGFVNCSRGRRAGSVDRRQACECSLETSTPAP